MELDLFLISQIYRYCRGINHTENHSDPPTSTEKVEQTLYSQLLAILTNHKIAYSSFIHYYIERYNSDSS